MSLGTIAIEPLSLASPPGSDRERIGRGLGCSLALHAAIALLIVLGLPRLVETPPSAPIAVPIDLVQFGERSASLPSKTAAAVPQARAPQANGQQAPGPVPAAPVPAPATTTARPRLKVDMGSDRLALAVPPTPKLPATTNQAKIALPAAKAPAPSAPAANEDLQTTLQSLTLQQQLQARTPRNDWQQDDAGSSNVTASSNGAALGSTATYNVKDFLRAQIERHWYISGEALKAGDFVVSIHIQLARNGTVTSVEILPDASYSTNVPNRELAYSARAAVKLSSPLLLPPGTYDLVKDVTLQFRSRDVMQ
jgi:hypothetical protein